MSFSVAINHALLYTFKIPFRTTEPLPPITKSIISEIDSGFTHISKSTSGIESLFGGVSIILGTTIVNATFFPFAYSFKHSANLKSKDLLSV